MRNGERATNVRSARCHVRRFGAREARPRVCPISSVRLPPHDRFHPSVASNRGDRFGDNAITRLGVFLAECRAGAEDRPTVQVHRQRRAAAGSR